MTGHSATSDQNAGPWDIFIYRLDPATKAISDEKKLLEGGFNGWPHLWVDPSSPGPGGDTLPGVDGGVASGDGQRGAGASPDEDALAGGCAVMPAARAAGPAALVLLLLLGVGASWRRRRCRRRRQRG